MSGRIACLVGVTDTGEIVSVAAGRADSLDKLLAKRLEIRAAGGLTKLGRQEVKLSELYCLSNATAGGELKARLRF